MNELLKQLANMHAELKKRGNEALAAASPLDAAELQGPIMGALREFQWVMSRVKDFDEVLTELTTALPEHVQSQIATALAAKLEAGDMVSKADSEAHVVTAEKAKDDAKVIEISELRASLTTASERRAELMQVNAEAAAFVSDADLLADDFAARKAIFAKRQESIAAKGITLVTAATAFEEYSSIALSEEGTAAFDGKMTALDAVLAAHKPAGTPPPKGKGGTRPDLLNASKGKPGDPPKDEVPAEDVAFI